MTTQRPTAATPIPIPADAYDLIIFDRVSLVHPDSPEADCRRREGRYAVMAFQNGTYPGAIFYSVTAARRFLRDQGLLPQVVDGLTVWNRPAAG